MVRVTGTVFNSDFDYLKQDASAPGLITIPSAFNIAGGSAASFSVDLAVGASESLVNTRFKSSKAGNQYYVASVQQALNRTGVAFGSPAAYSIYFYVSHVSGNIVRFTALILNPYSGTLTTEAGVEIIEVLLKTFKQPTFA